MTPRRLVELAFLLPVLGALLLLPPMVMVVSGAAEATGLPLFVPYLFAVWAFLIAATRILSRRLERGEADAGSESAGR